LVKSNKLVFSFGSYNVTGMLRAKSYCLLCVICILVFPSTTYSAPPTSLPGPADVGRIKPEEKTPVLKHTDNEVAVPEGLPMAKAPSGADQIHFVLHEVNIEGSTVFSQKELKEIYAAYLEKEVALDVAWQIAAAVREHYRVNGYFLSRAYVPAQNAKGGKLTIKVIEGYIGSVELKDSNADSYVFQGYIDNLKTQRPVKADDVENFILNVNDIPGVSFHAVLSVADNQEDVNKGAVKLNLLPGTAHSSKGMVTFDNYGSRFLGPNEVTAVYQGSIIPQQSTTVTALTSVPTHELKYGTLTQSAVIAPNTTLQVTGGYTKAYPGYNLKQFEIVSNSKSLGANITYQAVRQRDVNLNFGLTLDSRNTNSDILNTPLTRDRTRALRANVNYSGNDNWYGFNSGNLILTRGLKIFNASNKGDLNLSRADAEPNFTKVEMSLSRLQGITKDWTLFANAYGQYSYDPLFTSEEYGYGGQAFGRAYNPSDITGEHGISGSLELRYTSFDSPEFVNVLPYIFYDIGEVWNMGTDSSLSFSQSGSSAGFGMRFDTDIHLSGNIGIAFPLTLPATTPIYGYANRRNPRLLLQISQGF